MCTRYGGGVYCYAPGAMRLKPGGQRHNYNYTAFSRIRSLAALFVLKGVKLTLDILNHPCDKYDMLVVEMARLTTLSSITLAQMPPTPQPSS